MDVVGPKRVVEDVGSPGPVVVEGLWWEVKQMSSAGQSIGIPFITSQESLGKVSITLWTQDARRTAGKCESARTHRKSQRCLHLTLVVTNQGTTVILNDRGELGGGKGPTRHPAR